MLDDPASFYARLVADAPVWRVGDTDVFTVNSYAAVTEACRRVEDFSSRLAYLLYRRPDGLPGRKAHGRGRGEDSQILATADPPAHARHKRLISAEFSPKRISSLEVQVAEMSAQRMAAGLERGAIEFMTELANLIPIDVVTELIAFRERNTGALFDAAIIQTDMLASAISEEELEQRLSFSGETFGWVFAQLQEAIADPGSGILGLLASAINAGEIDIPLAMAVLLTLFAAGGESTSSLIGNTVLILATDPELQRRLRENSALIPKLIEESLRLESPFRHHMRIAQHDADLFGVSIPKGATMLMMWGAANRDPAMFERPATIDLDRPRRHVGFGSGIHVCLGNTLARLEARVVIEALLAATHEFHMDDKSCAAWIPSLAVRRLSSLPLILTPR
ncbi:cytochrome P450 [Novosphingobium sp. JCM 18896]|uniref:cytochrome P450 n=1 Tax=Novosphingobium sp. JCM 18896 TaxID=2989731 RepID=UPI0022219AE3|nr:cytochrome P450 [Novosphingobium sp. JCM 18896]